PCARRPPVTSLLLARPRGSLAAPALHAGPVRGARARGRRAAPPRVRLTVGRARRDGVVDPWSRAATIRSPLCALRRSSRRKSRSVLVTKSADGGCFVPIG